VKRVLIYSLSAVLCAVPFVASAKDAKPAASAFKTPHNAYGQPDLSGYWSNATLTPTTRPAQFGARTNYTEDEVKIIEGSAVDAEAAGNKKTDLSKDTGGASEDVGGYNRGWLDPGSHVMRVGGVPRNSLINTPDGQYPARKGQAARPAAPAPVYKKDATSLTGGGSIATGAGSNQGNVAAQRVAARNGAFDNPEARSLGERCLTSFGRNGPPPMFANGFYNNNYEFVQSRDAVAINIEMVHDTRIVRIGGTHRTDGVRPWFGDSVGHYEGDTLVVETTNLPQRQAYMGSWQNLTVTERFTRVAKDRVLYQFTVNDPTVWEKPWGGEYEFGTLDGRIMEYACHEGNYALEGILAGGREEEKKAASETQPVAVK
jgi:hypothetical protein